MGKPRAPGWECVEIVSEKPARVQCTLCGHTFPGTGTRITEHLAGIGNQVKKCTGAVPADVLQQIQELREAAVQRKRVRDTQEALQLDPDTRRQSLASTGLSGAGGSGCGGGGADGSSSGGARGLKVCVAECCLRAC